MKFVDIDNIKNFYDSYDGKLYVVGCSSEEAEKIYFKLPENVILLCYTYIAFFDKTGKKIKEFKIFQDADGSIKAADIF